MKNTLKINYKNGDINLFLNITQRIIIISSLFLQQRIFAYFKYPYSIFYLCNISIIPP